MKQIDVLALGESLKLFDTDRNNIRVGVNDISDIYEVEHKVVVDRPSAFSLDRIINIRNTDYCLFYSQQDEWQPLISCKNNFVKINPSYAGSCVSSTEPRCSISSAFVAVVIAASMKPDRINLYGADFLSHGSLSEHSKKVRLIKDFSKLKEDLYNEGIELKIIGNGILKNI